jgi:glycine cleavage system transcriptional repressor
MANLLVCTAQGAFQPKLIPEISRAATECQCNILDMRSSLLAEELSVSFVLSGHWNALAKFEHNAGNIASRLGLAIQVNRSKKQQLPGAHLPYSVQIFAGGNETLITDVTAFFIDQGIIIQELFANTYQAHQTDSPATVLNLAIAIPADVPVNLVRDSFQMLCDECNMDGILEPIKN